MLVILRYILYLHLLLICNFGTASAQMWSCDGCGDTGLSVDAPARAAELAKSLQLSLPNRIDFPRPHYKICRTIGEATLSFLECPTSNVFLQTWSNDTVKYVLEQFSNATGHPAVNDVNDDVVMTQYGCDNGLQTVPYPLVCDHLRDCSDGSDENFCHFLPCTGNTVQCIPASQCIDVGAMCNGQKDCLNDVDELECTDYDGDNMTDFTPLHPPAIVHLNPLQDITVSMETLQSDERGQVTCPESHFQCGLGGYCLPVFLRCNGVSDCPNHEDEHDCGNYACPGFYRCRGSRICLHASHVCDGLYQCPRQDDELYCDVKCPANCTACHGLAFNCPRLFDVHQFPTLRYLDASHSGLPVSQLTYNIMIVYLSLAKCQLYHLDVITLPNVRHLDVSDNNIRHIGVNNIRQLRSLRDLVLSGNPLESSLLSGKRGGGPTEKLHAAVMNSEDNGDATLRQNMSNTSLGAVYTSTSAQFTPDIHGSQHNSNEVFPGIRFLDMSRVPLLELGVGQQLPGLQRLNLSYTGLDHLHPPGFKPLGQLRVLDVTGCPLSDIPPDVFKGLDQLRTVLADTYRMCCDATLPEGFNVNNCRSPQDAISSCQRLLKHPGHAFLVPALSALAVASNVVSMLARHFGNKSVGSRSLLHLLLTHLCLSDLLMGVYLAIISVVDLLYRGTYLWQDVTWRHSAGCKLAGFVFVLSNTVSPFLVCLISAQRSAMLLVVPAATKGPSSFRNQMASRLSSFTNNFKVGYTVCAMFWVCGLIPVVFSGLKFPSQSSICVPVPVRLASHTTHFDSNGLDVFQGTTLALSSALHCIVVACIVYIYVQTNTNSSVWALEFLRSQAAQKSSEEERSPRPDSTPVSLENSMHTSQQNNSQEALNRHKRPRAVSDYAGCFQAVACCSCLCRVLMPILDHLTSHSHILSDDSRVTLFLVATATTAALQPLLFGYGVLQERQRQERRQRMLKIFAAKIKAGR